MQEKNFNREFSLLSYQLRRPPGPHGLHGPHIYAQRMAMDPRFAYPAHIPRHGDPSLNRLPHNYNMQVNRYNYKLNLIMTFKVTVFTKGPPYCVCGLSN